MTQQTKDLAGRILERYGIGVLLACAALWFLRGEYTANAELQRDTLRGQAVALSKVADAMTELRKVLDSQAATMAEIGRCGNSNHELLQTLIECHLDPTEPGKRKTGS